jgi:hypothetical protein
MQRNLTQTTKENRIEDQEENDNGLQEEGSTGSDKIH